MPSLNVPTPLLDFESAGIQKLIRQRGWADLAAEQRVRAIYRYVRDEVPLGFNARDEMAASGVLAEGYGQCNTKAILLGALLRGANISCRFHAAWVDKSLQKGALGSVYYAFTPRRILHSWVEAELGGRWYALEGVIVDTAYLRAVQRRFKGHAGAFRGYAVSTPSLANPAVEFGPGDTYIQHTAVVEDLGVFASADEIFARYTQGFTGLRGLFYEHLVRKDMNRRVAALRRSGQGAVADKG